MSDDLILVVDDDEDIRDLVERVVRRSGYRTISAPDGATALTLFMEYRPQLVVLDLSMPEMDGFDVLERLRLLGEVPVLLVSARDGEHEKVRGLRSGADDYLVKPFGNAELVARIDALLRRAGSVETAIPNYRDQLITVDFHQHLVTAGGVEVALTPLEFRLLTAFVRNAGQVLTHERLRQLVWKDRQGLASDQVKIYVGYLRRKLKVGEREAPIETLRGVGYRFLHSD